MEPSTNESSPAIPIAIIFGFAMIALAIFFTNKGAPTNNTPTVATNSEVVVPDDRPRVVDETDYIYGNPNAPILIIEYSDYECPFCKQYHTTLNQIMDEYGVTGRVAWVYRQFPLTQLHPNAARLSEAALCVGDIGGNEAFWEFSNQIFEERDIEAPTNVTLLPQYALEAGVFEEEYIQCMDSGRMREVVLASAEEAYEIGARGTPYSIITVGNEQTVINGAQSYDLVKSLVQDLVEQIYSPIEEAQASTETP